MLPEFHRYLRLLGFEQLPAGLEGLGTLVRRHLAAVPFENISKLLLYEREGAGRPFVLSEFLDGIEFSDLGGTCYACNSSFAELLRELGYDASLLGADMSKPDMHTAIRVRIDSVSYLVDVGDAAPFREPMRLDCLPLEVNEGENRYVLEDAGDGRLRMGLSCAGKPAYDYVVHNPPRPRDYFIPAIETSFALTSIFMKMIRISRIFDGYSLDLLGRRLYRHETGGGSTVTELSTREELSAVVRDEFRMPRCPVEDAIAVAERIAGMPYF